MSSDFEYLTFYVLGLTKKIISIHKISVDIESVKFTGAWSFSSEEKENIQNIVADSYVYYANENINLKNRQLDFNKFVSLSKEETDKALSFTHAYIAEDAKKRKNLVLPDLWSWPEIDFSDPKSTLRKFGVRDSVPGTSPEFENVLTLSRLIKFIFEKWLIDENLRCEKKYLQSIYPKVRLYPDNWLNYEH